MIDKIMCLLGRHKYVATQEFTDYSRRIACRRCRRMFAMNDDMRCVVPWDSEFHRMYEVMGHSINYKDWEGKCS